MGRARASPERVAVDGVDSRPDVVRFGSPRAGSPGASHAAYAPSPRESAQAWSSRASIFRLTPAQQDIVSWMLSLGVRLPGAEVAGRRATSTPKSTEILEEMAKGLLLCDLATRLEGVHVGDVCARPKVTQEAMHNANRALDVFRRARRCRSDHMWSAREIAAGDAATCWGLLGDLREAYGDARKRRSIGRHVRVPPASDARSAGRKSPVDAGGGETAASRARPREASPTKPSRPSRPSRPSGSDDWRRGGAARTLAERGYPSPLAKAAAAVSAARASRARRERDARWTAAATRRETRPPPERDGSPTSPAGSTRRASASRRTLDPEGGPGSRYSRGGAIRSPSRIRRSSEGKGKPRAASATTRERPGYDPSGYVSPNEGGRRRARRPRGDFEIFHHPRGRVHSRRPTRRPPGPGPPGSGRRRVPLLLADAFLLVAIWTRWRLARRARRRARGTFPSCLNTTRVLPRRCPRRRVATRRFGSGCVRFDSACFLAKRRRSCCPIRYETASCSRT